MKNIFLIATLSFLFFGCNSNPNKGARIQKLEAEVQESIQGINKLEDRVQTLESVNKELKARITELEK